MSYLNDNPGQGNRGGQQPGEDSLHKSQRNQDSQRHETQPESEDRDDSKDDKFSPGEPDDYNAEEFSTD